MAAIADKHYGTADLHGKAAKRRVAAVSETPLVRVEKGSVTNMGVPADDVCNDTRRAQRIAANYGRYCEQQWRPHRTGRCLYSGSREGKRYEIQSLLVGNFLVF